VFADIPVRDDRDGADSDELESELFGFDQSEEEGGTDEWREVQVGTCLQEFGKSRRRYYLSRTKATWQSKSISFETSHYVRYYK